MEDYAQLVTALRERSLLRTVLSAVLGLVVLTSTCGSPVAAASVRDLISELRRPLCVEDVGRHGCLGGLGVTLGQATDSQLRDFLDDSDNRRFIESIVRQNAVGQNVHRFVYENQRYRSSEISAEKQFLNGILLDTAFAVMEEIAKRAGMYYLSATLQAVSALNTLLGGRAAVSNFVNTVATSSSMSVIHSEYFAERIAGKSAASAFTNIYAIYEPLIDQSLNLMSLRILEEQRQRDVGQRFFESRYQAWRLATSQARREAVRDLIGDEVAPQPVKVFSISGRVTSQGAGLQGAVVTLEVNPFQQRTTYTDANGRFSFQGLAGGLYTLIPEKAGLLFTPPSLKVLVYSDLTGQDFAASGSGVSSLPVLRIDGGTASQRRQLETFSLAGTGFTPGASVTQHIQHPDGTVKRYSAVASANGRLAWEYTPPCTAPVGTYSIWLEDPNRGASNRVTERILANSSCSQGLPDLPPTATILVMDVSGSMGYSWKGGVKIDSAKEAALQFIEQVTNESRLRGGQHEIGVVAFSGSARLLLPLTSDYQRARQIIISLDATNSTNLGAGLTTALTDFSSTPASTQRLIILLSDGNTNRGLSREQILSGSVAEARGKKICIHTVAFGDPGDVDDEFLRKIAYGSGCGTYNHAESSFELFSTYLKLRHRSFGQVAGEYSSAGRRVTFLPGQAVTLGTVIIGPGKRELHYTLAWSKDGTLQARIKDPSGRVVTTSYPGAQIYTTSRFAHVSIASPQGGTWTVEAYPLARMPSGTEYYAVLSTRPGGVSIPLPLPVFTIGDRTFGLPAGLPTWLLVTISVALIAAAVYMEFFAD